MRRIMPIKELPKVCIKFTYDCANELKNMRENFLMHLLTLTEYSLLSTNDLCIAMQEFDKNQSNLT